MIANGNFLMPGNDNIVQNVIPTDKPVPQEPKGDTILDICNNDMSSYINAINAEKQIKIRYDDISAY